MAVRALVFDVFGTLVDWRSGVAAAFRASGVSDDPYGKVRAGIGYSP
jgi:2-haloacid dehalogenase